MRTHSALFGFALVLALLFGTAFRFGSDKAAGKNGVGVRREDGSASYSGGLKLGEYACYGSGGEVLIGLGFKVLASNRYTDLDGKEAGSFTVEGDTVTFRGGHLDGQVGRNLRDYKFNIHSASCEPFK